MTEIDRHGAEKAEGKHPAILVGWYFTAAEAEALVNNLPPEGSEGQHAAC